MIGPSSARKPPAHHNSATSQKTALVHLLPDDVYWFRKDPVDDLFLTDLSLTFNV